MLSLRAALVEMGRVWTSRVNVLIAHSRHLDLAQTMSASAARPVMMQRVTPTEQQLKSEAYQSTRVFVTAGTTKTAQAHLLA